MLRSFRHSLNTDNSNSGSSREGSGSDLGDAEKHLTSMDHTKRLLDNDGTAGVTFFIKKSAGMTKSLKAHNNLLTLLDGPYPNNPTKSALRCDQMLLMGGGIGISGLIHWGNTHPNVKLCWSMKKSAEWLVEALSVVLKGVVEKDIWVGQRLEIRELLNQEVECGWAKIGVVVCRPSGLCDDVRATVVQAGKSGPAVFELEVDTYSC